MRSIALTLLKPRRADAIIAGFLGAAYVEGSRSGGGVHAIGRGHLPPEYNISGATSR